MPLDLLIHSRTPFALPTGLFILTNPPPFKIRFLGDPAGEFTKALELDFDSTAIFGNRRSKRYALVLEDGKVKSVHVEPDNTGTDGEFFFCLLPKPYR